MTLGSIQIPMECQELHADLSIHGLQFTIIVLNYLEENNLRFFKKILCIFPEVLSI